MQRSEWAQVAFGALTKGAVPVRMSAQTAYTFHTQRPNPVIGFCGFDSLVAEFQRKYFGNFGGYSILNSRRNPASFSTRVSVYVGVGVGEGVGG